MKHRDAYSLFLLAFSLGFAGLLISGAPRLIASEETGQHIICRHISASLLYSAPSSSAQSSEVCTQEKPQHHQRMDTTPVSAHVSISVQPMPGTDANGNILGAASYMRSVYQVFALGDGFA